MVLDGARASSPIRVVLVDDSADVRGVLTMLLDSEPDFSVVAEAGDGHEGIQVVAAYKPHLVLLDIAMPVMDGLQALTVIREDSPGSIVVMLSAFSESSGLADKALALGAHGYIQKGVGASAMVTQLREVLAREFRVPDPT